MAIGYAPNSGIVKDLVKINEQGKIIINHQTQKLLWRVFGRLVTLRIFYTARLTWQSATPSKRF